ncbi:hypothetical protein C8J56DRAFT_972709, partial [Mycena floridula]
MLLPLVLLLAHLNVGIRWESCEARAEAQRELKKKEKRNKNTEASRGNNDRIFVDRHKNTYPSGGPNLTGHCGIGARPFACAHSALRRTFAALRQPFAVSHYPTNLCTVSNFSPRE